MLCCCARPPTTLEQSRRQQHDRYHNYGRINGLNNGYRCICLHYQPPFHDEAAPVASRLYLLDAEHRIVACVKELTHTIKRVQCAGQTKRLKFKRANLSQCWTNQTTGTKFAQ